MYCKKEEEEENNKIKLQTKCRQWFNEGIYIRHLEVSGWFTKSTQQMVNEIRFLTNKTTKW